MNGGAANPHVGINDPGIGNGLDFGAALRKAPPAREGGDLTVTYSDGMHEGRTEVIEVLAATAEQAPIVANLLELYAHDFSEFYPVELGENGRYGYPRLTLYWKEQGRHPFLVKVDGRWAGLVLAKRGSEVSEDAEVWDMAEFFVVRRYRRRGVGVEVARMVWKRLPGRWEVRVMESNVTAWRFWERAIGRFLGTPALSERVESGEARWRVFRFESTEGD